MRRIVENFINQTDQNENSIFDQFSKKKESLTKLEENLNKLKAGKSRMNAL